MGHSHCLVLISGPHVYKSVLAMGHSDCLVLISGPHVYKSQSAHLQHKLLCNFYFVCVCIKFTDVVVGHVTHAVVLCGVAWGSRVGHSWFTHVWQKIVKAYFKLLSWPLAEGTVENHGLSQWVKLVAWSRIPVCCVRTESMYLAVFTAFCMWHNEWHAFFHIFRGRNYRRHRRIGRRQFTRHTTEIWELCVCSIIIETFVMSIYILILKY